jgi:hypothetical protein
MKSLPEYIQEIETMVNARRNLFFPSNAPLRKRANLRLGREFGYGLAHFDGYKKYIQTSYSRVIVKNSFDSTGVAISSREWVAALNEGIEQYKQYKADVITLIDKK